MIELVVEEYCSQCPEFEPDVDKKETTLQYQDFKSMINETVRQCDTIVRCKHAARCSGIKLYLETKE